MFAAVATPATGVHVAGAGAAAGEGFGLLVARTMLAEEFVSKAEAAAGAAAARTPEAPRLQTSKLRAAVDALLTTAKRDNQLVRTAAFNCFVLAAAGAPFGAVAVLCCCCAVLLL